MNEHTRIVNDYSHLSEQERWKLYSQAKRDREALERQGVSMAEPYDAFIKRIVAELGV